MNKKLPKKLFVKWDEPGDGEQYLVAAEDAETLAGDVGNTIDVGIYELVSTAKLATRAEFQADKRRKRR